MNLTNKITRGGEIKEQGDFNNNNQPFYLFLMPKAEGVSSIALTAKISYNKKAIEFPFVVNCWNPIVVNSVNIAEETLSSYRVFWGMEG